MKMFKKLMAVVLTGVMAVSMLTGCALTDNMKKTNALKALSDVATAQLDSTATVNKIKFEEKSSLNSTLNKYVKDMSAEDVADLEGYYEIDGKDYLISAVEVKSGTTSVSNFKDYALNLLAGLDDDDYTIVSEVKGKTETVKAGVKVDSFKNSAKKSVYYAIILVEAEADAE